MKCPVLAGVEKFKQRYHKRPRSTVTFVLISQILCKNGHFKSELTPASATKHISKIGLFLQGMYKFLASLLLWSAIVNTTFAQLPAGAIAPDFMATDVNGQPWHLYDLLNQHKIVFIELGATWCPPCWAYHQSGALQQLHQFYGPGGEDAVRVMFIEADPSTNPACLFGQSGCNSTSPGNWTTGTPFPVINHNGIADLYDLTYFPTLFMVCPNKKVYEIPPVSADGLWERAQGCPVAYGENNAGIFNYGLGNELHEICDTTMVRPGFTLINLGSNALTSATLQMKWNDNVVQTLQWSGNLPLYGEAQITLDSMPVSVAGTLTTNLNTVNGNYGDQDLDNNQKSDYFTLGKVFNNQRVLLKIKTDNYGYETYWELRDENGQVLEFGGNESVGPNGGGVVYANVGPGSYGNNVQIKDTLDLPGPGCYSIRFVDAYGDGMCCNFGNGYYRLYNLDNPATPIISGGDFNAYDDRGWGADFLISSASNDISSPSTPQLLLSPNPAQDQTSIQLDYAPLSAPYHVRVVNTLGALITEFSGNSDEFGAVDRTINTSGWRTGVYRVQVQFQEKLFVKPLVVVGH